MNRRVFLTKSALALTAGAALNLLVSRLGWALTAIDISKADSPAAKRAYALGYIDDLKKGLSDKAYAKKHNFDVAKKSANKSLPADRQRCDTCQFYTKTNDSHGECTLLKGVGLVAAAGSCNTWVHKPGTK